MLRLNIVALMLLAGASLLLTNLADKRLPTARATQLSQLAALTAIEVLLVLVHRA